jgi:hypothetical protein
MCDLHERKERRIPSPALELAERSDAAPAHRRHFFQGQLTLESEATDVLA